MHLHLSGLLPEFMERDKISGSEIWDNDVTIGDNEMLHIVAPSGNGKTSIIHFIYGLRKDFYGKIKYDNSDINKFTAEDYAVYRQKKISIVFQDMKLFPELTVRDNLEIKRVLAPYEQAESIEEMARRLGISSRLDKKAGICSYGEQQRIAIIRSLLQPFELLLLDEPFSHLDEDNRLKASELILDECKKRKAAVVLADLNTESFFPYDRLLNL